MLTQVELPGGTVVSYLADSKGRRVSKLVDGVKVQGFLYQNVLKPVVELDGNNNIVARFVYGSKSHVPDYMLKGGQTYRIISDHLGSVRLVVNSSTGTVAQRLDYDEYGVIINDSHPGFQPFAYAGGLYDVDTGLVRFGARDYDASVGRWLQSDPIGLNGGWNTYVYVGGNPLKFIDPFGLTRDDINTITEQVAADNPDLNVDPYTGTLPMIGGGDGVTSPLTEEVYINSDYLDSNLSKRELVDLERVIIHENLHRDRGRVDMIKRPRKHKDIYDEAKDRQENANKICYPY